jgi:hypothetical protein
MANWGGELGRRALALRGVHLLIAVVEIASLVHLWRCALTGRRDRALHGAVAALLLEGAALSAGRGDCPLKSVQHRVGDPVPLFELVLPPGPAKGAVPVLAAVTTLGFAVLAVRGGQSPPGPPVSGSDHDGSHTHRG